MPATKRGSLSRSQAPIDRREIAARRCEYLHHFNRLAPSDASAPLVARVDLAHGSGVAEMTKS